MCGFSIDKLIEMRYNINTKKKRGNDNEKV